MTTLSSYLAIANNLAKWQSITSRSPAVTTATNYFEANIGSVKSASDLTKNTRLFDYAMTAFGLGDRLDSKGLMTQVLKQGVTSSTALAKTLANSNILAFAKAFDFADNGSSTTSSSSLVRSVVAKYTENALETDQGRQNPGVQLALYFQNHAPAITDGYGILADKNLLTVVQTALGVSPMTGLEPIDQQASMLASKIKFSDFRDPTKLQAFISRFAAMYDYNNGSASGSTSTYSNAILLGASQAAGVGTNMTLLQSLQGFSPA
ncbi:MAG: DUF1217 domain-containing protein [Hyphomicrobiales bacterium]|nr:DUF1217 domain-containing protein [Hyphomicrobiales bacterium]